jgi:Uma2 family endonuclease
MAIRVTLTYADYAAIPNDGRRYEIHEGELAVTPAPGTSHQRVSRNLLVLLHAHAVRHQLGEVFVAPIDCILDDTTVVQPDLVFVTRDRLASISPRGIEGAPSLVVEVLSPGTVKIDRGVKTQLYARHGVLHYWIVDPEARVIEAHVLRGGVYEPAGRLEGTRPAALPPFPELALDPAALWP